MKRILILAFLLVVSFSVFSQGYEGALHSPTPGSNGNGIWSTGLSNGTYGTWSFTSRGNGARYKGIFFNTRDMPNGPIIQALLFDYFIQSGKLYIVYTSKKVFDESGRNVVGELSLGGQMESFNMSFDLYQGTPALNLDGTFYILME